MSFDTKLVSKIYGHKGRIYNVGTYYQLNYITLTPICLSCAEFYEVFCRTDNLGSGTV